MPFSTDLSAFCPCMATQIPQVFCGSVLHEGETYWEITVTVCLFVKRPLSYWGSVQLATPNHLNLPNVPVMATAVVNQGKKKILFAVELIHVAAPNLSLLPLVLWGWVHLLYLVGMSLILHLVPDHLHQNEEGFFLSLLHDGVHWKPVQWKELGKKGAW